MSDTVSCPVCCQEFDDPRVLPCGHDLCYRCLSNIQLFGYIKCPYCCKSTDVPLSELPKSSIISNAKMEEDHKEENNIGSKHKCTFCAVKTNLFCSQCGYFICKNCTNLHQDFPLTRSHPDPTPFIEPTPTNTSTPLNNLNFCEKHNLEKQQYCKDCHEIICQSCSIQTNHKYHRISSKQEAAKERQKYLRETFPIQSLHQEVEDFEKQELQLKQTENLLQQDLKELEEKIHQKQQQITCILKEKESLQEKKLKLENDVKSFLLNDEDILDQSKYCKAITNLARKFHSSNKNTNFRISENNLQSLNSISCIESVKTSKKSSKSSITNDKDKLNAQFIEDVQINDGDVFGCNVPFIKVWAIRNTGTVSWPEGCELTVVRGEILEYSSHIPPAEVGQTVEVSVSGTTPLTPGNYITHFRITTPSHGIEFGPRVWLDITVE